MAAVAAANNATLIAAGYAPGATFHTHSNRRGCSASAVLAVGYNSHHEHKPMLTKEQPQKPR
ncbi:hypothetical protein WCLP8_130003 [uncultured Gammaproteobacteria bacterium]